MSVAVNGQTATFATSPSAKAGWAFEVTVTTSNMGNTRVSQAVVTLQVLPSGAPIVTLTSLGGRALEAKLLNSDQTLQLVGSVSSDGNKNITALWTVDGLDQGVSLSSLALTPIRVSLTSTISIVYLVLPPHSLPAGSQLTFALSCSYGTGVTTTYMTILTNAPPTPGSFG